MVYVASIRNYEEHQPNAHALEDILGAFPRRTPSENNGNDLRFDVPGSSATVILR